MESNISRGGMLAVSMLGLGFAPLKAAAQSTHRVAIVCEPGNRARLSTEDIGRFESRLSGALLKSGHFSLVDRQRLDRVIREQGFSNSAYADPRAAAKLGKLVGAERFLNVQLTATAQEDAGGLVVTIGYHVSADFTLVDTTTGNVSSAGSADGDAQNKLAAGGRVSSMVVDALQRQAIDACIEDLVQQLIA